MANTANPITADFASSVSFGNKVTKTTIANKATQANKAGNAQFNHSLTLGSMMVQVSEWWNNGGKQEVVEAGFDADFKSQTPHLTGLSHAQYCKLKKAYTNSVDKPEVFAEYQAAEDEAGQACNVERWNSFVKEGKLSDEGDKPAKGKYKAQLQVTGICKPVRINEGGHLDTDASDDDVVAALAVLKRALLNGGHEVAAGCITLPEEMANGETPEEVVDTFYASL